MARLDVPVVARTPSTAWPGSTCDRSAVVRLDVGAHPEALELLDGDGMTRLDRVAQLIDELCDYPPQSELRQRADALARELVNARPAFLTMGLRARDSMILANARIALDAVESDLLVRYDTCPLASHVLQLVLAADISQDAAVRLLGGHP